MWEYLQLVLYGVLFSFYFFSVWMWLWIYRILSVNVSCLFCFKTHIGGDEVERDGGDSREGQEGIGRVVHGHRPKSKHITMWSELTRPARRKTTPFLQQTDGCRTELLNLAMNVWSDLVYWLSDQMLSKLNQMSPFFTILFMQSSPGCSFLARIYLTNLELCLLS